MLKTNTEAASRQQEGKAGESVSVCPNNMKYHITIGNNNSHSPFVKAGYAAVKLLILLKENFRFHIAEANSVEAMYVAMNLYIKAPLSVGFHVFLNELNSQAGVFIRKAEFLRELVAHPDPICKIVLDPNLFDGFGTSNFSKVIHCVFGSHVGNRVQYNLEELEDDIENFFKAIASRIMEFVIDCDFHNSSLQRQNLLHRVKYLTGFIRENLAKGYLEYLEDSYGKIMIPEDCNLAISFNLCRCDATHGSVSSHAPLI